MEFIDCDVSQFSTSRPSLTHTQPNPQHLRVRKTWDEYCHRIQRFNASDPLNQPKSALSAKMDTTSSLPSGKVLAAATESMEDMMRRLIAEAVIKPKENKRTISQAERDAYKRGRNDARPERPPFQDRHAAPSSNQTRDRARLPYRPPAPALSMQPTQGQHRSRSNGRPISGPYQRNGNSEGPR